MAVLLKKIRASSPRLLQGKGIFRQARRLGCALDRWSLVRWSNSVITARRALWIKAGLLTKQEYHTKEDLVLAAKSLL